MVKHPPPPGKLLQPPMINFLMKVTVVNTQGRISQVSLACESRVPSSPYGTSAPYCTCSNDKISNRVGKLRGLGRGSGPNYVQP
jgi:hypothetical protein